LTGAAQAAEPGLLFYLSADKGTTADVAAPGTAAPTFDADVSAIADGARGPGLQCNDLQRLAWTAPGNIYAQRGTLSFYWRSRYPVGPTAFPLFRVGYADHSSWDMAWLRIDYNGHGFDAFVTDASLSRTRVSVDLKAFPKPDAWTLVTFTWDEKTGIRFYLNGKLAASRDAHTRFDAALDQFGPHSRIISPHNVQSDYNFARGGDIDEIRIYDSALPAAAVAALAKGQAPQVASSPAPDVPAFLYRYGWEKPQAAPPYVPGNTVSVRKVEILDAYDLKRWWWKATDGIRETTWPGVYNRSRLPGRNDYFQLPDWDTYVEGGKAVSFALPDEPVNHLEIAGAAWGNVDLLPRGTAIAAAYEAKPEASLFARARGHERTVHALAQPLAGRIIRFTNVAQEQPIGELGAYDVGTATEPAGSTRLAFRLGAAGADAAGVEPLRQYIEGRFPVAERQTLIARPVTAGQGAASATKATPTAGTALPVVQVLIPDSWDALSATDGLDGIAIDLPALKVKPTGGGLVPMNIQVKDPLWPLRNMLDFSFSVKPGEAKTLWLDLRDRILPANKGMWISIASAARDFDPAMLEGAQVRLVFKPRRQALAEHEIDRLTQARDSYAMLVEEHPKSPKLALWVRFESDLTDLLRVNPQHPRGREYAAAAGVPAAPPDKPLEAKAPAGVPLWAFRQTELLGHVKKFVNYYIDKRQVAYGDFGGGISDDTDLLNTWPGVALMGSDPDKIRASDHALLEAAFKNGMFTNGLPTIQTDELHSYEEGINALAQNMILEYGSPRQFERAMQTARGVLGVTGVNAAGHRHMRSSYYSGTRIAEEEPWGRAKPYSHLVMQPGQLLVDFNGNAMGRKYMTEMADGLLAHRRTDGAGRANGPMAIRFSDDKEIETSRGYFPWHVYWGAYKWSGDKRYLAPLIDGGLGVLPMVNANTLDVLDTLGVRKDWGARVVNGERGAPVETRRPDGRAFGATRTVRPGADSHLKWQLTGDKSHLEALYAAQIDEIDKLAYINTEGGLWIDRVSVPTVELQRARLGGVALARNALYPGHVVSWRFAAPANDQSVAILVREASATGFKVVAYNLDTTPVHATMTGWNIDPGQWEITQGVDSDNDDVADQGLSTREEKFERSRSLGIDLAPRSTTVLTFTLKKPGKPYWSRPDLGIDREDVVARNGALEVKVHSLGGVASGPATLLLRAADGRVRASAPSPALAAPDDQLPKPAAVTPRLPAGSAKGAGATVEIDAGAGVEEITALNNVVKLD
jgi:hypothetical protein